MFGERELVEGDQRAVHEASGRCLLFECRVSGAHTLTHTHASHRVYVVSHVAIAASAILISAQVNV